MNPYLRNLAACLLVGALVSTGFLLTRPASAGTVINGQLVESTGSTDMLGGGDYALVKFGSDAAFGVVWGNSTHHNNVYIVVIKARYLGVAQVYDTTGRQLASNRPVKFYTLYAMKLMNLIEFRDANGNNIADYRRGYNGTDFTWYSQSGDEIYKRVDLNTNWTRGNITELSGASERSWTFNLTATNQPYAFINHTPTSRGDNMLNKLQFTFHLNASLMDVANASVNNWKVTVDTSGTRPVMVSAQRLGNLTFSGKVATYRLKWDQIINGWDFEPGGPGAHRLLLEFGAVVGNFIPAIAETWFQNTVLNTTHDAGGAQYRTPTGNSSANDTTGDLSAPQRVNQTSPSLSFGGDWTRIGRFAWVSDSTVDGVFTPNSVYGEVLAGRRIVSRGESGSLFLGFVILGGLTYPKGTVVEHDPDASTDALAELTIPSPGLLGGPGLGIIIIVAVVVAGALVGLLFFISRKKRRGPRPPGM